MIYTDATKAAMRLCYEAHAGQVDKAGLPYVFHPYHLAEQMETEYVETCGLLRHEDGVPYMDYVAALVQDPVARRVKMADLRHNSDLTRLPGEPTEADLRRAVKYREALSFLEGFENGPVA